MLGYAAHMKIKPFLLERYFAEHEFSARYLLSSSDCDGWPQAEVLGLADDEMRRMWDGLRLGYTESRGLPLLRKEIAALYAGVSEEDVLVLAPEEGVFVAMNCLLEAGDHVICTGPGYQSLHEVARSIGCEVELWRPEEEDGWRFDPGRLERMFRPKTKLLVVNFPHNPTGHLPSKGDYRLVVDMAARRGVRVFSDEMYRLLELDPADRLPSACELHDGAVTLSGMSKAFGLAGLRIGWLVTRDQGLCARLAAFKDYTTICNSAPSEILALIGLRAKEKILERHRARIAGNLGLLDGFFARRAQAFRWVRPKAGTVGFPRLLQGAPEDLCAEAVRRAGVMLAPASAFGHDGPNFRIGFGRENMPEALECFERFLDGAK